MNDRAMSQGRNAGAGVNAPSPAVMGFVLGAALGAGVALLFAPAPGSRTRRKIGVAAGQIRRRVNRGLGHAMNRLDSRTHRPSAA